MTDVNLNRLLIKDFRSLKGTVAVPLDAPVIILHGSNGMGKTSVLSAIELALTSQIAHLARIDPEYANHIVHRGAEQASISLYTHGDEHWTGAPEITVTVTRDKITTSSSLDTEDAKFFSERCYLPQATLGRLLELYQDANADERTSQLTQFVNDLLHLDQLDALVDGLHSAFRVDRVRNLIPEFRRFENLSGSVQQEIDAKSANLQNVSAGANADRAEIETLLRALYPSESPMHGLIREPQSLIAAVENDQGDTTEIVQLTAARQEVQTLLQRWNALPKDTNTAERESLEQRANRAREQLTRWEAEDGHRLALAIESLRIFFPDLPSALASNPAQARQVARSRAAEEKARCDRVMNASKTAEQRVKDIEAELNRLRQRMNARQTQLKGQRGDANELARALAGIIPHLHDENCPVCGRNFKEVGEGPLAARVSAKIASLTTMAGQLESLTASQAADTNRLTSLSRDLSAVQSGLLAPADATSLALKIATLTEGISKLDALEVSVNTGTNLMSEQARVSDELARANSRNELASQLASQATTWRGTLSTYVTSDLAPWTPIGEMLATLAEAAAARIKTLREREENRRQIVRRLATYLDKLGQVTRLRAEKDSSANRQKELKQAAQRVGSVREDAKAVSNAARTARTSIVGRVFNKALNKMWRDLFVRLAPREEYVPAFKLASKDGDPVEAGLETVHRSGDKGGPPGTMLSAGNLNTAALTLFLALHLSVKNRLPWIILDDPVQSMDDVHIAQFAALLRTLAKTLGRQVIIAVHDRALFDYLALELSPAFEDDRLITVELTRSLSGDAVADPKVLTFAKDALAA